VPPISVDTDHLLVDVEPKPELIAQRGEDVDYREPPIPHQMLPESDRYVVPSSPHAGSKGFFTRDASRRVTGIHTHGRFAPRVER
jgi:hypothetical protein